jgi:hypothetical protein
MPPKLGADVFGKLVVDVSGQLPKNVDATTRTGLVTMRLCG